MRRPARSCLCTKPLIGGEPVIGVGLAWPLKSPNPSSNPVFACVRCSRNQAGQNAAAAFLDAGGREARSAIVRGKGADADTWPIWRWIRTEAQWWTALDSYRQLIVSDVMEFAVAVLEPLRIASPLAPVRGAEATE